MKMFTTCSTTRKILVFMIVALLQSARAGSDLLFHRSRPDIFLQKLDVHLFNESLVDPGFIFWTTAHRPTIYDFRGELIWYGSSDGVSFQGTGLHVCDYDGKQGEHLCLFDGEQTGEYAHGMGYILDSCYQVVKTVQVPYGTDLHEFSLVDNGKKALLTTYSPVPYDLSKFGITNGVGWIEDSSFRDVDVFTGKVNFEWHSIDHVLPDPETTIPTREDRGRDHIRPLDYFHINSLDKNSDGDYLISARHMSTIFKLSGKDGHIIWELSNRRKSSFRINDFTLFGQHHARWISENATHTVLSLFNNGATELHNITTSSAGLQIIIDHSKRTSSLLRQYKPPSSDMLAPSMGSMQPLPSGNVFMGWGFLPSITEHLPSGAPVFHASFSNVKGSYRAVKAPWKGQPTNPPDLWVYSRGQTTTLYMSWNGATEIATWKLYLGASETGPFEITATAPKKGFETMYTLDGHHAWAFVEAVSADGAVLGTSRVMAAFVPPPALAVLCDDFGCPNAHLDGNEGSTREPHVREGQAGPGFDSMPGECSFGSGIEDSLLQLGVVAAAMAALVYTVVSMKRRKKGKEYGGPGMSVLSV